MKMRIAPLGLACCAAWAQVVAPPPAVWTPASGAPASLLTALEAGSHDKFLEQARAGNIRSEEHTSELQSH